MSRVMPIISMDISICICMSDWPLFFASMSTVMATGMETPINDTSMSMSEMVCISFSSDCFFTASA